MSPRTVNRHKPTGLIQVVLGEGAATSCEHRDDLVGVDSAPGPGALYLLGVLVQGCDRLGRRLGHAQADTRSGPVGEMQRHFFGLCVWLGPVSDQHHDLLQSRAHRHWCVRSGETGQLIQGHVDHGPDVEEEAVGIQPPFGPARGLAGADALKAGGELALDRGKGNNLTRRVPQRRDVVDLRKCHDALVGGVVGGNAVEEVRVLGRRKRGAFEVLQPPQLKALTYQRMHAADDPVLPHAPVRGAEGELHLRPGAGAYRDRHASADDQDRHIGKDLSQHRGDRVRVG